MPKRTKYFNSFTDAIFYAAELNHNERIEYVAMAEEGTGRNFTEGWTVSWYEPGTIINTVT